MSEKIEISNHLSYLLPEPMSGNNIDMLLMMNKVNSLHEYWKERSIVLMNCSDDWIDKDLYKNIEESKNGPFVAQKYVDFLKEKLNISEEDDIKLLLNKFMAYNSKSKRLTDVSEISDVSNLISYVIFIDFCTIFSGISEDYLVISNGGKNVSELCMLDYFLGCVHLLEYTKAYTGNNFYDMCLKIYGLLKEYIHDDAFGKYAIRYASEI